MEGQLLKAILMILREFDKCSKLPIERFSDAKIAQVFYWAAIHDRPISWACDRRNWPPYARRGKLPSDSTMSRRLRTRRVIDLLDALERRVTKPTRPGVYWMIDGKPLPIGGCSKDRQAGYGRAANSKAKGYKLHAIVAPDGSVGAWRVAPMNKDERVMAKRMLKSADIQGYVVGDANYDSNPLHEVCDARGNHQLVTPRRYGPGRNIGHRAQSPGRLRSIAILENPDPQFGKQLMQDRNAIERQFSQTTTWGGGLTPLPAWVRTHRRVRRWVQAKLALTAIRKRMEITTYVN